MKATDGEIGRSKDFLFDEDHWTVRYMVADTGKWLPGRKVLISPMSLGEPDWASKALPVALTKKEVEEAPSLEDTAHVSRKFESKWLSYYRYPFYWVGDGIWGAGVNPRELASKAEQAAGPAEDEGAEDTVLRSADEVMGYHIEAKDGEIGHVEDFVLDDETWMARYVVVNTRNWLPGKRVIVAPSWIEKVDWASEKAFVDLTRQEVKDSPEYDPSAPINREYEVTLYDYYGRPKYWKHGD